MRRVHASELPKPNAQPAIARYLRHQYPEVYVARSITDMQEERNEQLINLLKGHAHFTSIGSGDPSRIAAIDSSAIIFLPQVRHFPAADPNEERRKLFGLLKQADERVRLDDKTGDLVASPNKHSFMDFPYVTSFDQIIFGEPRFDKELWDNWRERSWKERVVLMAQFACAGGFWNSMDPKFEDIIDRYWLLHIQESGPVSRRRVEYLLPEFLPVPVLNPVGA